MALQSACTRTPRLLRLLSTTAPRLPGTEKRYVRIAGPAAHASQLDISLFLNQHSSSPAPHTLQQGQSDIYQNHSVWVFDAGSQPDAEKVASRISGRSLGLKLIRAAAVDQRIVDGLLAVPEAGIQRKATLRKRLNIIAPVGDQRGRALLATNLPYLLQPRLLWAFFGGYDVVDVRHLRKSGVACVVFTTNEEAERALRERSNFALQGKNVISLKMHE